MTTMPRRRSLLLAGGLSPAHNYPRYEHELLWWADRLDSAGFECWGCLGDGRVRNQASPWLKVTGAGRAEVMAGLAWLADVGSDGLGLLVVSNHGDRSGICLWGADTLSPAQLGEALQPARGTLALVMGQCHGGVFGALASPRIVVLSACTDSERSWACPSPPGLAYDEFLYQLGTALFGSPADASQPGPARRPLCLLDAFHWARAQDRRQTAPEKETPTLFDPGGLAGGIII